MKLTKKLAVKLTDNTPIQRPIQPVRLGGRFQYFLVVNSRYGFTIVRELKHTSQPCCDKTMD